MRISAESKRRAFALSLLFILSGCASFKDIEPTDVYCSIAPCPGYTEYKKAGELYIQSEVDEALTRIDAALKAAPGQKKYGALRVDILKRLQYFQFQEDWEAYGKIPKGDLAKRSASLKDLKYKTAAYEPCRDADDAAAKVDEESKAVAAETEALSDLPKKTGEAAAKGDCDGLLALLAKAKYYRAYLEANGKKAPAIEDYRTELEGWIDKEYAAHNYRHVVWILNKMDELAGGSGLAGKRRAKYAAFYKARGDEFLRKGRIATAVFYMALADRFKPGTADKAVVEGAQKRLADYKEKLYVAIQGGPDDKKTKESLENAVREKMAAAFAGYFGRAQTLSEATVAVTVGIDRLENAVEQSKTRTMYSKFVSGYNRVPNDDYYRTERQLQDARARLRRLERQRTDTWAGAIVSGLAQGVQAAEVTNLEKKMASDDVYDKIPILVDYSYQRTDVKIANAVGLSYRIVDMKRKKSLKEDTFGETGGEALSVLENVHPEDNGGLVNSTPFDPAAKKQEFDEFAAKVFQKAADNIAGDASVLFDERAKDYAGLGELADAVDSHLTGYILKAGKLPDTLFDALPKDAAARIDDLSPQSGLAKKLAKRTAVQMQFASRLKTTTMTARASEPAAKAAVTAKAADGDGPALVEGSRGKIVFVKNIAKSGISQGSGFLVSPRGHVVTSHRVVRNATAIVVRTSDGAEHVAKVVKADSASDLALLKVDLSDAPFFKLCDSNALTPGQAVVAVGSPQGAEQAVSRGVISELAYMTPAKSKAKLLVIRTDVPAMQGNGGGPLLNEAGEVVGVHAPGLDTGGADKEAGLCAVATDEIRKRLQSVFP